MEVLRHRGPDDGGVWCDGAVALGHRRLSIVDRTSAGHQPMSNEDGSVWVTCNGELYNWPETRPLLMRRGHQVRSGSDSEMLVHLWEEQGPALLESLRGMFAFGLYDVGRRTLMLARDRAGEKPLYWHDDGRRIVFASEIKALLADASVPCDVDLCSLAEALTLQYVPSPGTIWKGVRKLPAGHRLMCDAAGPRVERYWRLPLEPDTSIRPGDAVSRLGELLAESVRVRLMSDVPLGALLSGGIDSSTVVAHMAAMGGAPVRTFSIGFEGEDVSELRHARTVSQHLGTVHEELVVKANALELLPRLVCALDEPFFDDSFIPTHYVAELARRQVTVVLSGDGGDETFAGYRTYRAATRRVGAMRTPIFLRRLAAQAGRLFPAGHRLGQTLRRLPLNVLDRHLEVMSCFTRSDLALLLAPEMRGALARHDPYQAARECYAHANQTIGSVPSLLALDFETFLAEDILVKVDRMSMLHSLEVRAPLLDHVLLEYVARLPFDLKLRGDTSKWALRESVRHLLPPGILERDKQGFGVPLRRWFGEDLGRLSREVLLDSRARRRGWLDYRRVERLVAEAEGPDGRKVRQIFALICLELWAQAWVDREGVAA